MEDRSDSSLQLQLSTLQDDVPAIVELKTAVAANAKAQKNAATADPVGTNFSVVSLSAGTKKTEAPPSLLGSLTSSFTARKPTENSVNTDSVSSFL